MAEASYSYDSQNRLIRIIYPDKRTISFVYDNVGRLIEVQDPGGGNLSFQYDLLDRLVKSISPPHRVLSFSYDPAGNRKRMVYPDGQIVSYDYNKNSWLTEITLGDKRIRFEYDGSGRLIKKIFPNQVAVSYVYNPSGRLIRLITTSAKGSILFDLAYGFDAVGNCVGASRCSANSSKKRKIKYFYDNLYRVVRIKDSSGCMIKYRYDVWGNRLEERSSLFAKTPQSRSLGRVLNALGLMKKKVHYSYLSENILSKAGDVAYRYDDRGNLAEKKYGEESTRYIFDYENRLGRIEHSDRRQSHYAYDAMGRRIVKKISNGKVMHFLYDGYNLIQTSDDRWQMIANFIYDGQIDHPVCMIWKGKIFYYLLDLLGSVIALADESGEIVAEYEYDAWGNILKEAGDIPNPFRFTGREWDAESGLYYYRTRYYDPSLGRFISRDAAGRNPFNKQKLNKYVYVCDNPQSYIDPFGLFPISWDWLSYFTKIISKSLTKSLELGYFTKPYVLGGGGQYVFNFSGLAHIASVGKTLGAGGSIIGLTSFIPHFYNPDPLQSFTNAVHTSYSILGGMYGVAKGATIGFEIGGPWGAVIGGVVGAAGGSFLLEHFGKFLTNTIVTRGQNILQDLSTNVGGVLFDKVADVLTDLEEIQGAYWDENASQIVLVGKKNEKIEERQLPRMDKDHLAVALRAVFSGDNLGVSIDPPPDYLESGDFPPDGTMMAVRYLGQTEDTLFGAIMFEADRLLKMLSMGKDNISQERVTSQVPEFQNELDLGFSLGTEKKNVWHRMWFVIEDMMLDLKVKETSDRSALCFGKATIKVKGEYLSKEKDQRVDPAADRFTRHFTAHFDEFAKEFPILERLRELAKISAIAKFLKNSGKPVDLSFLLSHEFIKVPTPRETTGIRVSKTMTRQDESTTQIETRSIFGGVDFDFRFRARPDDGEAKGLKAVSQEGKPCDTALAWDVRSKGKTQRVVAFPLAKSNGNYRIVHTDFSLPSPESPSLELSRGYDSFRIKPSPFGYGWNIKIDYEIAFLNKHKSEAPLLFIQKTQGCSHKCVYIADRKAYVLVEKEKDEGDHAVFSYDPTKFITRNPDATLSYQSDGLNYTFDSQGRLSSVMNNKSHKKLEYLYENDRLVRISDSIGNHLVLIYDENNRIKKILAPHQTFIDYQYDRYGDLIRVLDNRGNIQYYTYDEGHRLIKIMDSRRKVLMRNSYDSLGRVIKTKQSKDVDDLGNLIERTYDDDGKLLMEKDRNSNMIRYEYDRDKNLSKTVIVDRQTRKLVLEHDDQERIKNIIDPAGYACAFSYDGRGNIISMVDPNHGVLQFAYDKNCNRTLYRDSLGNDWKWEYDDANRVKAVIDPLGRKIEMVYDDNNQLRKILTPEGTEQYEYDDKGRVLKWIDPNGKIHRFFYDPKERLVSVEDPAGNIFKYQYDPAGNLESLCGPDGMIIKAS
jgi:RHS repeat-associated protein